MPAEILRKRRIEWKGLTSMKDSHKAKLGKNLHTILFNNTKWDVGYYKEAGVGWPALGYNAKGREQRRVNDVMTANWKYKFCLAGHITRFVDNSWTHAMYERHPRDWKRPLKRFLKWGEDNLIKWFGPRMKRRAQPRKNYKLIVTISAGVVMW